MTLQESRFPTCSVCNLGKQWISRRAKKANCRPLLTTDGKAEKNSAAILFFPAMTARAQESWD
jgi:hypothetical protein